MNKSKFKDINYSIDQNGFLVLSNNDLVEYIKEGWNLKHVNLTPEQKQQLDNFSEELNLVVEQEPKIYSTDWFIPEKYLAMDIEKYLLMQCLDKKEIKRIADELIVYRQKNLLILLQWAKYFVDTLTANNLILPVGRGSSVSSFCLYKLGIHRINSLEYELDFREFLK